MKNLFLLFTFLALLSGCATMAPPQVTGSYSYNKNMPTVGLNVIDAREEPKVGTIGLASFSINDLELYLYETIKNQINEVSGINFQKYENLSEIETLRLPVSIEATLKKAYFVSADALLDDVDGEAIVQIKIYDLESQLVFSRQYSSTSKRKAAWPRTGDNNVHIEILINKIIKQIILDQDFKEIISF